ncbi:MAG: Type II secretion system protein D [Verrucomicrobia subdivision 3 bacterium]|nr:Type II secretion system protein D [Limisphaerales bacterium]MCS1412500.1 Type II secretion system protein D [Limisphaerales bacterium]
MQYFHEHFRFSETLLTIVALLILPMSMTGQGFGGTGRNTGANGQREYFNNTMLGDALIEIDPETRSLIIITDEETNTHIDQIIKQLDQPKPQVLIKVVFVEVTHRDELDVGIESINYRQSDDLAQRISGVPDQTLLELPDQTLLGLLDQTSLELPFQGGVYRILDNDFSVTARAMAEAGNFEVLSRPSILARNNQEAIITVGQEVPFVRNTQISSTGQQINTLEYEDVGIILRVTPFITSDGLVEMIVAPEISTITDRTIPITDNVNAPVIAKRSAETVVVTGNGQTVVIGGLMERNKTESIRKVPLLGDIPVLGWAFRRKIKEDTKTELLIFLTPYVVNQPDELQRLTRDETDQTEFTPNVLPGEPLEKYIDNSEMVMDPSRRTKKKPRGKK